MNIFVTMIFNISRYNNKRKLGDCLFAIKKYIFSNITLNEIM